LKILLGIIIFYDIIILKDERTLSQMTRGNFYVSLNQPSPRPYNNPPPYYPPHRPTSPSRPVERQCDLGDPQLFQSLMVTSFGIIILVMYQLFLIFSCKKER
jgi:hypothetical protein